MLFLKETRVETIIPMPQAIEAVEEALAETSRGNAVVLPRRRIHHTNRMLFGVLPGSFKGAMGAYLQTDRDRTIHHETVILYSVETGEPLILFQDCSINELRTGAAGGVGAKHLASPDARRVAVIGSEKHAFTQLQAVCAVRPIDTVRVFSPTPAHRLKFADHARAALGLEVTAADSAEAALEGSDIVITATNAQSPVFEGRSLRPGMHVTSIANGDKTRVREEIDHGTMTRAAQGLRHFEGDRAGQRERRVPGGPGRRAHLGRRVRAGGRDPRKRARTDGTGRDHAVQASGVGDHGLGGGAAGVRGGEGLGFGAEAVAVLVTRARRYEVGAQAPGRHSRETGRVKTLTSGHERPLRHSRESGNPGVLEGSLRGVSPLHPAWIPAFAGMTISGAVASLGCGFDTTWKAGIQGRGGAKRTCSPA